jgi:hypothetical protein
MKYKLTRYEQETVFNYNRGEKTADIYTYDPALIRKLNKSCKLYPETFKFLREEAGGRFYLIPKKCVSVRIPSKRTPEQLRKQRDNMLRMKRMVKNADNSLQ